MYCGSSTRSTAICIGNSIFTWESMHTHILSHIHSAPEPRAERHRRTARGPVRRNLSAPRSLTPRSSGCLSCAGRIIAMCRTIPHSFHFRIHDHGHVSGTSHSSLDTAAGARWDAARITKDYLGVPTGRTLPTKPHLCRRAWRRLHRPERMWIQCHLAWRAICDLRD